VDHDDPLGRAGADRIEDAGSIDVAAAEACASQAPLARDLHQLRPRANALRLALSRAKAAARLFGATEPARVGRFVLLGPVTTGGMGAVYSAYDPQLDRRVALKVLHPDAQHSEASRQRLLAEARALARLDHPNIVPVHDALIVDAQVVVVMEWVEGQTLASWEHERKRAWREVVEVYLAAGRGLAAVHRLGLVHRDFKPTNAIIGADGRVRILDFGLARFDSATEAQGADGTAGFDQERGGDAGTVMADEHEARAPLTVPGEVLGTLGFMAPEQLEGKAATAAADQFSFCVALYRAVCGVAPYRGSTASELAASWRRGRLREPAAGSSVPRWLRAALARGLAVAPAARYPSMRTLLDELGRARGWRRWRTQAAVAAVAITALLSLAIFRSAPAILPSCDLGAQEIAAHWAAAQRDPVEMALSRAGAAPATVQTVLTDLDRYREEWARMHRTACLDHRGGAQSDALLDQRMLCLRRRKDALSAAAQALPQVSRESVDKAREVVAQLSPISDCADLEQLAATTPLPASAAARATVSTIETQLAGAIALERLGPSRQPLEAVRTLESAAAAVAYPPLLVELKLSEGRMLLSRGEYLEASTELAIAEQLALTHGLWTQAVEAGARRLYVEAMAGKDLAGLLQRAEVIEPLSRSLRGDRFVRPLLLSIVGTVYMAMEQREAASEKFAAAAALVAGIPNPDLELSSIDLNLAMLTRDDHARETLVRRVWELRRGLLGDDHLLTLEALLHYGKYVRDPARAMPLIREACERYRAHHAEVVQARLQCEGYRALLSSELGDHTTAASIYDELAELIARSPSAETDVQQLLARGSAALERGELDSARRAFEGALAASTGSGWWILANSGIAHLGIGLTWRPPRSRLGASTHLERAISIFAQISKLSEDTESFLRLARARAKLEEVRRPGQPGRHRR
jgi:eukaryotic-like serine/threonine-protein kinase